MDIEHYEGAIEAPTAEATKATVRATIAIFKNRIFIGFICTLL